MRKILTCILMLGIMAAGASTAAAITYVPDDVVCENRDGRQLIIKTYTLQAEDDPALLEEEPFEREGFLYALATITKQETPFEMSKNHSETVTVETSGNDLSVILDALAPNLPYNDGEYSGILALDHTSLKTEATSYSSKSYTISETKTIGPLDRNDPAYVPKTTVKNGRTLSLANVEWSVQGTSLAGDTLVPTQFMAVATYKGSISQLVANGYLTTVTYSGEIVAAGLASIIYTVTYLGEELTPAAAPNTGVRYFICAAILLIALGLSVFFLLRRKNTNIYAWTENGLEYELVGREKLSRRQPNIDLRKLERYPSPKAVVEIKQRTARCLFGRVVRIRLRDDICTHLIEQSGSGNYWFTVTTAEGGTE